MDMARRERVRSFRGQMRWLAYVLIAAPFAAAVLPQRLIELVAGIPIGLGILWWQRRRPAPPEHLASIEFVVPGDAEGIDTGARAQFYMPWCDCGWLGDDHSDAANARREAATHTTHVRDGIHRVGE
jgi:hypothetical protein